MLSKYLSIYIIGIVFILSSSAHAEQAFQLSVTLPDNHQTEDVNSALVSLVPVVAEGYEFVDWGGDCSGNQECTVDIRNNPSISVNIIPVNQSIEVRPDNPHPLLLQATESCSDTSSPHWECSGRYLPVENLADGVYLATCPIGAGDYLSCYNNGHTYKLFENLLPSDGVLVCDDLSASGQGISQCVGTYVLSTDVFLFPGQQAPQLFNLQVTKVGEGTITSSDNSINCGSDCSEENLPAGTQVTLSAQATADYQFDGWSGACSGLNNCVITVNSDTNVTANFSLIPINTYSLNVSHDGNGSVISNPSGINCGSDCSGTFPANSSVTLMATPTQGYAFNSWSGACAGTVINTCTLNMDGDKSIGVVWDVVTTSATLNTQVTLTADPDVVPTSSELVSFALPLAKGVVMSTDEIRVTQDGIELPIYVEAGLRWHWTDNSIRSVTIQLQNVSMINGDITLQITDSGRNTASDLIKENILNAYVISADPNKAETRHPRVWGLHDPVYLSESGLIPPYKPAPAIDDAYQTYVNHMFDDWGGTPFNYHFDTQSRGGIPWLFDRASSHWKLYMQTGELKFLKEAHMASRYYQRFIVTAGDPATLGNCSTNGRGGWYPNDGVDGVSCQDGKFIYTQPIKLTWALTGDNTYWDLDIVNDMAEQARIGSYQWWFNYPYDDEEDGYTERSHGIIGLANLNAWEITGNAAILSAIDNNIAHTQAHQQTAQSWDINNGWTPMPGCFRHSWMRHEDSSAIPAPGLTDDRRCSPWMSENIADYLWQAYWTIGDPRIPEILRFLAEAINNYAFDTSPLGSAAPNHGFQEACGNACTSMDWCTDGDPPSVLYSMSDVASQNALLVTQQASSRPDTHLPEMVLILAAGRYFETNAGKAANLDTRMASINPDYYNLSCVNWYPTTGTERLYNWQLRGNAQRTWDWVAQNVSQEETQPENPPSFDAGEPQANESSITLFWSSVANASSYLLQRCTDAANIPGSCTPIHQSNNLSFTDTELTADTEYTYTIQACNAAGCSTYTTITVPTLPDSQQPIFYDLTVSTGTGGQINSSDSTIDCGNHCSASYAEGSQVTLTATEQEGYLFDGWSGDCVGVNTTCVLTMDGNKSVSASFSIINEGPITGNGLVLFQDVTTAVIDSSPGVNTHFGISWVDANADGCQDIFINSHSNGYSAGMWLQNQSADACQGTFSFFPNNNNYHQSAGSEVIGFTANWLDVDGNGGQDIIGWGEVSQVALYLNNDPFAASYGTKTRGCPDWDYDWCSIVDVDGDKDYDWVTANSATTNSRRVVDVLSGVEIMPAQTSIEGIRFLVFDVDNDSWPDIVNPYGLGYWSNNQGNSLDWVNAFNNFAGRFDKSFAQAGDPPFFARKGTMHKVALDYDLDGDLDIFYANSNYSIDDQPMEITLARNDGNNHWTDVTAAAGFSDSLMVTDAFWFTYSNSVVGDFNNDRYPDILMTAASTVGGEYYEHSPCTFFINNGNGTFTIDQSVNCGDAIASSVSTPSKEYIDVFDYDEDGLLDIAKTDSDHGSIRSIGVYRNVTDNSHHWLKVQVIDQGNLVDGISSRVTVYEPNTSNIITHYQVLYHNWFDHKLVHAGLAQYYVVDVEVVFPHNGNTCLIEDVSADQHIIIRHDCSAVNKAGEPINGDGSGPGSDLYNLTVSTTTGGLVTSNDAAINCGNNCSASYTDGEQVTLSAAEQVGYLFEGWAGDCSGIDTNCALTMDGHKSVSAAFAAVVSTYTLQVNTNGNGIVTSSGGEINCGNDCSEVFTAGSQITLSAQPEADYTFSTWSGACSGSGDCVITVNADTVVNATFTPSESGSAISIRPDNPYPLVLQATESCSDTSSPHWQCSGRYLSVEDLIDGVYLATCPIGAAEYSTCHNNGHVYKLFENLLPTDGVLACDDTAAYNQAWNECASSYVLSTDIFNFNQ